MNANRVRRHTSDHDDYEQHVVRALRERGYRITAPRKKIIEALCTAVSPKTAKEIAVRTKIQDASTVYRTLAELVKEELAEEFQNRGVSYFEHVHDHHDHAVCDSCGAIEHIPCATEKKPRALTRAGWRITSHESLFRGLCQTCKK